jgi:tungstate transport system substrate-binding protein
LTFENLTETTTVNHHIIRAAIVLLASIVALQCLSGLAAGGAAVNATSIRLALVNIPDDIVRPLLPEFQKQTGLAAEIVYTGDDPYVPARAGKADLVISHYGHHGVVSFVSEGLGLWPHPVFANQMALFGPPADPAKVRGLSDAAEALARIAASKSAFVVNRSPAARYLEEILWSSAKIVPEGGWYDDAQVKGKRAFNAAARKDAYVLWGLPPFLRLQREQQLTLEPLVIEEPLFQRIMVAVVVNPDRVPGVDRAGAEVFEQFLLTPATQAWIRAFRYPGIPQQVWWPAGRHNDARE